MSRGDESRQLRYEVENAYEEYQSGSQAAFYLIKSKKVTEYGEGGGSGKSVSHTYSWGNYGNLVQHVNNGGGDSNDAITTVYDYVADNADEDDAKFFRMKKKYIVGTDPLTHSAGTAAYETYYYDGHSSADDVLTAGLLTKTATAAGWTGGGESLYDKTQTIDYTRGSRGELSKITDNDTGIYISQTHGFGSAVLKTQTNNKGHTLTRTIDSQGRITKIADDNGLSISTTYDGFNRPTKTTVTGSDGKSYPVKATTYTHTASPYYNKEEIYDTAGAVENEIYTILDGFGQGAQSWSKDADGGFLVNNNIYDLRGLLQDSTHPASGGTSFATTAVAITADDVMTSSRYDAFGTVRKNMRDKANGTGAQYVYLDEPRQELKIDESGYKTKLTYDAHHRLTKVEQGKDTFKITAKYSYDPIGRMAKFKNGNGVYYTYSYDGAGRLRQVSYGGNGSATAKLMSIAAAVKNPVADAASVLSSGSAAWFTYPKNGSWMPF